ncbi:YceD family protein [Rhodoferax sp. GW822-FHT02A01]|uniref:YceD family protein n=1 Tax=Rhodoferax sp. GW822-FHT02A01 TaxID=3141537 RepID=UPI00315DB859
MKHEFAPQHLHIAAFAKAAGTLAGEEQLSHFERLMDQSQGVGGETFVTYSARGEVRTDAAGLDEPWVHLSAQASLALVCQRCLGPVDMPVEFERDFRFVASEHLAEVEDEESEEDVLVLSKSFNLLELIEDELLLATPLVPMHEVCPEPVKLQAADPDFEEPPEEKPSPFAVLQQLKKKDAG